MIDLVIKQSWLEKSSEAALEEFKSVLIETFNSFPEDRHVGKRWSITQISEDDKAQLIYDQQPVLVFGIEGKALHAQSM